MSQGVEENLRLHPWAPQVFFSKSGDNQSIWIQTLMFK
jgi:hypothetical protein